MKYDRRAVSCGAVCHGQRGGQRPVRGLAAQTGAHRLVGLVVKVSASRAEDPGFESRLRRDFSGVESYQ